MNPFGRFSIGRAGVDRLVHLKCHVAQSMKTALEGRRYSPWMSNRVLRRNLRPEERRMLSFVGCPNSKELDVLCSVLRRFETHDSAFNVLGGRPGAFCLPDRNANYDLNRFRTEVRQSLDLLSCVPTYHRFFRAIVSQVLPLSATDSKSLRSGGSGSSFHGYFGGIFVSLPTEPKNAKEELALNLLHESAHQALMLFQGLDPIIDSSEFDRTVFSPIRKTNRPIMLSFHACYVLAILVDFLGLFLKTNAYHESSDFFRRRRSEYLADLNRSVLLFDNVNFSPIGRAIYLDIVSILSYGNDDKEGTLVAS